MRRTLSTFKGKGGGGGKGVEALNLKQEDSGGVLANYIFLAPFKSDHWGRLLERRDSPRTASQGGEGFGRYDVREETSCKSTLT